MDGFRVISGEELYEELSGVYFFEFAKAEQVIRSTPDLPKETADQVIATLKLSDAMKGEYLDAMQCGYWLGSLYNMAKTPEAKSVILGIASRMNDLDNLPMIKRNPPCPGNDSASS